MLKKHAWVQALSLVPKTSKYSNFVGKFVVLTMRPHPMTNLRTIMTLTLLALGFGIILAADGDGFNSSSCPPSQSFAFPLFIQTAGEDHINEDDYVIDAVNLIPVLAQSTPDEADLDQLFPVDTAEVWFADAHVKVNLYCPLPAPHDMFATLPFPLDAFMEHDTLDGTVAKTELSTTTTTTHDGRTPIIMFYYDDSIHFSLVDTSSTTTTTPVAGPSSSSSSSAPVQHIPNATGPAAQDVTLTGAPDSLYVIHSSQGIRLNLNL